MPRHLRSDRLGMFTFDDRQAAGSLLDLLLAGVMASDQAQPIPSLNEKKPPVLPEALVKTHEG